MKGTLRASKSLRKNWFAAVRLVAAIFNYIT